MAQILSTREVAQRLGIAHSTVTWRARNGQLPYLQRQVGTAGYLFDSEVIDAMAEQSNTPADAGTPRRGDAA